MRSSAFTEIWGPALKAWYRNDSKPTKRTSTACSWVRRLTVYGEKDPAFGCVYSSDPAVSAGDLEKIVNLLLSLCSRLMRIDRSLLALERDKLVQEDAAEERVRTGQWDIYKPTQQIWKYRITVRLSVESTGGQFFSLKGHIGF